LEEFVAYRSDPAIARYQSWDSPYPVKGAAAFIKELQLTQPGQPGEWYQFALVLRETGQLIGDCAFLRLADEPRQAEIGFTLAQAYHGCGYASEGVGRLLDYLFDDLRLHRVYAICHVDNLASAKLLTRLGMRREGHFVESIWFKGGWASEYWYAILKQEWLAQRANRV
jgi:aminoglycoside 6'-N-acetyltransferase